MGYTFTLPLFKYLGNCRVGCYIHSPLLTSEMLVRYYSTPRLEFGYQRPRVISHYSIRGILGLMYHKMFAKFYSWAGGCSDIVMVNSSWTEEHINHIWQCPSKTYKVFPPCDVEGLKDLARDEELATTQDKNGDDDNDDSASFIRIISVGQFRPEKDHPLQIRILYQLRELLQEDEWARIRLVIIGSCRHKEDAARVKDMEDLCKHLSVEQNVEFRVDVSHAELREAMGEGLIGIHTMWNEQFGIGSSS
jgi:alpha-1,2-mannosyltransferase